ncbi:MAG: sensor histidine kinase [Mariniblastus sp.]|jgi:signal transduction histidine kinase
MEPIDELRKRYNELARLAGSLAHEIKNPLSIIVMNMELLHEDLEAMTHPESQRAVKRTETVIQQCHRLETLLNDFLRFTKLSSLELKPGCLNNQIDQVLDFFETQAAKQGVEIIRYLDAELPSINLDPQTLQAALVNLVKNAMEAMPGGGQLVARTRTTRKGVALDLIDTGCGMAASALINMFQEFYTSKDGGTGLGLPTAKKIIEAHDARINVQSEVDQGTQFTIEFPTFKTIG